MTPERWARIKEVFGAALEKPESERAAFLDEACAADASLRQEVELLLAGHDGSELASPVAGMLMPAAAPTLAAGSMLGRFRIEEKLGEGGMGVVYRAHDAQLRRTVALKVLPPDLAPDPQSRQRLLREARAASALNHPHICTLYDIDEDQGQAFLVMEYLAGETLAERLKKGPLPFDQTLEIGAQIADALDVAHKHGIIHRDLKSANVMLTKTGAKLLDFGLAKVKRLGKTLASPGATSSMESASITETGAIMGTPPYMAPEQLEGRSVDARSDLWALGVILYEMLTGRRPFEGASQASLIAAILTRDLAPLASLQPLTPPLLDHVVRRCLEKNPDARWDSAHDVADQLRWIREAGGAVSQVVETAHRTAKWRSAAKVLLTLAALAMASVAWIWLRNRAPGLAHPPPVGRMNISLSAWGLTLTGGGLAISPDGKTLVFGARANDEPRLYNRRVGEWEPRPLTGTEHGIDPFFSPDGKWVAYAVAGKSLQKVPVDGGPPQSIAGIENTVGGTWGRDGRIIVGRWSNTGLWSVPAAGGTPQPLTPSPEKSGSAWWVWPDLLPGSKSVVFTLLGAEGHASIASLSLRTGEVRSLIDSGIRGRYLPTGHLIYELSGQLYAVPFDPERLEVRGASRIVVENIRDEGEISPANYAVSATGTLAYVPSSTTLSRLVWIDRTGNAVPLKLRPRRYHFPALSPDGKRLAVTLQDGAVRNVWTASVDGEPLTRLTFGADDLYSLFTPDGKRLVFTAVQNGQYNFYWTPTDGSGKVERLTDRPHAQKATSWKPGGRILLFDEISPPGNFDVWQIDFDQNRAASPFVNSRFKEIDATFSPDGRWVAYTSNESGDWEVYVQAYPGPGPKAQVSVGGGVGALWNPRGGELFYQSPTAVMSVPMANGRPAGPPARVFPHTPMHRAVMARDWDVSPDGQRFLVVEGAEAASSPSQLNLVTNWFEELKSRVPGGKQ